MRHIQADDSHRAWVRNAASVAKNPSSASPEQLEQAIAYLHYQRSGAILTARRNGEPKPASVLARIQRRLDAYSKLLLGEAATV